MKYTVPVNFVIEAGSAVCAEERLKDLFDAKGIKEFSIHSPSGDTSVKPVLSDELKAFLDSEIQNNDDDLSGYNTDLDYVKGTLAQIPNEDLVESCEYGGDLPIEDFVRYLNEEFGSLYNKYGGGTIVAELLPEY